MPWVRCPQCMTNQLIEAGGPRVRPCGACRQRFQVPASALERAASPPQPVPPRPEPAGYALVSDPLPLVVMQPAPSEYPAEDEPGISAGLPVLALWIGLLLGGLMGLTGLGLLVATLHLPLGVGRLGCGLFSLFCILMSLAILSRIDVTDKSWILSLTGQPGSGGRWTRSRRRVAESWWWWMPENALLSLSAVVGGLWLFLLFVYICWPIQQVLWAAAGPSIFVFLGSVLVAAAVLVSDEGILSLLWLLGGMWIFRVPFDSCSGRLAQPAAFNILGMVQLAIIGCIFHHAYLAPPPPDLALAVGAQPPKPQVSTPAASPESTPPPVPPAAKTPPPAPAPAPLPPAAKAPTPAPAPAERPAAPIPKPLPKKEPPKPDHKRVPIEKMPDLLAYWTFDEGKGKIAADSSGHDHKGRLVRAVWTEGIRGHALRLGGVRCFDYGQARDFNFRVRQPFTYAAWIRTLRAGGMIVSQRHSRDGSPVIDIEVRGGQMMATVRDNRGEGRFATQIQGGVLNDGAWHHFAVSRNGAGIVSIFVDGEFQKKGGSDVSAGAITTDLRSLGLERHWYAQGLGHFAGGTTDFDGIIDEFCIFARELTEEEIKDLAAR